MSRISVTLLIGILGGTSALAQSPVASHTLTVPALASPAVSPSAVVARVNGVALTEANLREREKAIFPFYRTHGGRIPPSAEPEIRSKAMQEIVMDELSYQEARRRNLHIREAELKKGLRELRNGFNSSQAYQAAVAKKYGSTTAFERRIRRTLLVRQLWEAEVTQKAAVSTPELRVYYQRNQAMFVRPEAVAMQSITINIPKDATDAQKQQARKRAEQLLPEARAAKNYEEFGVLAEKVSEDRWHVMMGDHKWVHRGEVDPKFEPTFSLKAGETSGVVESPEGFHILRVSDRQPQRQMSFAEMRDRLRKELEAKRHGERTAKFEQLLRKNAKIEML